MAAKKASKKKTSKKASVGEDDSNKLLKMSKQALERMSDSRFKKDLEILTVPEVQRLMQLRSLTPGQLHIAKGIVIKDTNRRNAELDAKEAEEAAKEKSTKGKSPRKSKKKGPPFWRGFTDWFSSFNSGTLVKRRTPGDLGKKPGIRRGPNLGLRGRVPVEFQVSICEQVFGEGYILPGGAARAKSLSKPLLLTEGIKGLDLTAGVGGLQQALHDKSGLFLSLMEPKAEVVTIAKRRMAERPEPERRDILGYDPAMLNLGNQKYDWMIAREMMFTVADKPGFINKLQMSMFSGGQFIFTDLVLDDDANLDSEAMAQWRESEKPPLHCLTESQYRALLEEVDMEVLDFEDDTEEYAATIRHAWAKYVETIHSQAVDDAFQQHVLHEAEYWHSRLRAFESGDLKLLRIRATRKSLREPEPEAEGDSDQIPSGRTQAGQINKAD
jgi:cyclopropane fatty-acyl-phospholipid synthase-like methyltransferase